MLFFSSRFSSVSSATTSFRAPASRRSTLTSPEVASSTASDLLDQAKRAELAFTDFAAERGVAFYDAKHTKDPNIVACSSCHGANPTAAGQNVKTGKTIEPMAVSVNPKRFTNADNVDKWFRRNCKDVLGRECTPAEQGDFIAFMMTK